MAEPNISCPFGYRKAGVHGQPMGEVAIGLIPASETRTGGSSGGKFSEKLLKHEPWGLNSITRQQAPKMAKILQDTLLVPLSTLPKTIISCFLQDRILTAPITSLLT